MKRIVALLFVLGLVLSSAGILFAAAGGGGGGGAEGCAVCAPGDIPDKGAISNQGKVECTMEDKCKCCTNN